LAKYLILQGLMKFRQTTIVARDTRCGWDNTAGDGGHVADHKVPFGRLRAGSRLVLTALARGAAFARD
jgi:hypothetical protein